MNKDESDHDDYSELNEESCSEFTRSLKKTDHDDFLQLLKGLQPQQNVLVNQGFCSVAGHCPHSSCPRLSASGILMTVNLEAKTVLYLILLALMGTVQLQRKLEMVQEVEYVIKEIVIFPERIGLRTCEFYNGKLNSPE